MSSGVSIFLTAVCAILVLAIYSTTGGVSLDPIDLILMILGGLLASMLFWSPFRPYGRGRRSDIGLHDRETRRPGVG